MVTVNNEGAGSTEFNPFVTSPIIKMHNFKFYGCICETFRTLVWKHCKIASNNLKPGVSPAEIILRKNRLQKLQTLVQCLQFYAKQISIHVYIIATVLKRSWEDCTMVKVRRETYPLHLINKKRKILFGTKEYKLKNTSLFIKLYLLDSRTLF